MLAMNYYYTARILMFKKGDIVRAKSGVNGSSKVDWLGVITHDQYRDDSEGMIGVLGLRAGVSWMIPAFATGHPLSLPTNLLMMYYETPEGR